MSKMFNNYIILHSEWEREKNEKFIKIVVTTSTAATAAAAETASDHDDDDDNKWSDSIDGQEPHVHSSYRIASSINLPCAVARANSWNPVNLFVLHLIGYYWEQNVHEKQP